MWWLRKKSEWTWMCSSRTIGVNLNPEVWFKNKRRKDQANRLCNFKDGHVNWPFHHWKEQHMFNPFLVIQLFFCPLCQKMMGYYVHLKKLSKNYLQTPELLCVLLLKCVWIHNNLMVTASKWHYYIHD